MTHTGRAGGHVQVVHAGGGLVFEFPAFSGRKSGCQTWHGTDNAGQAVSPGHFKFQVKTPHTRNGGAVGIRFVSVLAKKIVKPTNCTPGYSPCLVYHDGADYDCAGGSGNGPYYTSGSVYQVNDSEDIYGLDSNNNGLGCE